MFMVVISYAQLMVCFMLIIRTTITCCCSHINSHNKSVVTGQAPVTLDLRNTPGKNTNNPRWYTHISQLTQFMPPPETYVYKGNRESIRLRSSEEAVDLCYVAARVFKGVLSW